MYYAPKHAVAGKPSLLRHRIGGVAMAGSAIFISGVGLSAPAQARSVWDSEAACESGGKGQRDRQRLLRRTAVLRLDLEGLRRSRLRIARPPCQQSGPDRDRPARPGGAGTRRLVDLWQARWPDPPHPWCHQDRVALEDPCGDPPGHALGRRR
jgi:hypothetical protein